jgi:hypothetical protein
MGKIYLLHFDEPYKHAAHYLGYVKKDIDQRLESHTNNPDVRLLQVIKEAGIGFSLARVWNNVSRKEERRLKNTGGMSRYCPICQFIKNHPNLY